MNILRTKSRLMVKAFGLLILLLGSFIGFAQAETPYSDAIWEDYYTYTIPKAVYTREESLSLLEQSILSYYKNQYPFDASVSDEDILQYAALSFEILLDYTSTYYLDYQNYNNPFYPDRGDYPEIDWCEMYCY
ncbi:MAG: hypothetical protein KC422_26310 [Trueperaceae bacterium]|nr:hypothetical protein [Trueperaceae bacterium]